MAKNPTSSETLIAEFASYLKRKNLSSNTIIAYTLSARIFYSYFDEPSVKNLHEFIHLLERDHLPATVNQRIHAINHFLLFLEDCRAEMYPELRKFRLPAVKIPRGSFLDYVISNEDCILLQERLKQDGQDFWYFVVRFLVTTGVRVSELTKIKVEHLACGHLDLYSKGGKVRRIYITDSLCDEALEWCQARGKDSGFLFSTKKDRPITTRGIHCQLKHFAILYGIDPSTIYPHSFRHRFAKNFLDRCGDIALLADLLGHESVETTRIYLTRSSKEQQTLMDEIVTW